MRMKSREHPLTDWRLTPRRPVSLAQPRPRPQVARPTAHLHLDRTCHATRLKPWQAAAWLGLVCLAFYGWRLGWPLNSDEANLGHYFGPAVRIWQAIGFAEVRGAPCWLHWPAVPDNCFPYLNHPPGLFWLMYALGGDEWALRLPGVVGSWLAAIALFTLLIDRVGGSLSLTAACLLILCPGIGVVAIGSYEPLVLAAGLWLWRLTEGTGRRPRILAALVAFAGTWIDWQFAFYAGALVVLRPWRLLLLPGAAAVVGATTVFGWRAWAFNRPFPALPSQTSAWDLVVTNGVAGRPDSIEWLSAASRLLPATFGWAICALAILGLPIALVRWPRFTLAGLVGGVTPLVVFANHALDHVVFYALLAPLMATCAIAPLHLVRCHCSGRIATALAGTACVLTCATSLVRLESAEHELPARVGRTLSAAARDGQGRVTIVTNYQHIYLYYVDHQNVLTRGSVTKAHVEALRRTDYARDGVRFLHQETKDGSELERYLDSFAIGVPELPLGPEHPALRWRALPPQ